MFPMHAAGMPTPSVGNPVHTAMSALLIHFFLFSILICSCHCKHYNRGGRNAWQELLKWLCQALAATPNRNCEQMQRGPSSYPALFWPTVSCCVQDNTCSPDLWQSLGIAAGTWPGCLGHSATSCRHFCQIGASCVRNSREGRTSVTSIHQFSGIFFSEAFFSGVLVASPCLKQSNNQVIYWVPTLSHVECDVIRTFAMTIAYTATFHCILPTVRMCILSWTHWRGTEPLFLL